jgi:hypothetical protein
MKKNNNNNKTIKEKEIIVYVGYKDGEEIRFLFFRE